MCEAPPDPNNSNEPQDPNNELLIEAMTRVLDESLSTEETIREILAKVGFNDPKVSVEECITALVEAHLQLTTLF